MGPFKVRNNDGKQCKRWRYKIKYPDGSWKRFVGTESKADTERLRAERQRTVLLAGAGYLDPGHATTALESAKPYEGHLDRYLEWLLITKKVTQSHNREVKRCVTTVAKMCAFVTLGDFKPGPVETFLTGLLKTGRSPRTRNVYLVRTRAFLNWTVRMGLLMSGPLSALSLVRETSDATSTRSLTLQEFRSLISLSLGWRSVFYATCGLTGLRFQECSRLQLRDLDLASGWLLLRSESTKSRRSEELPLCPELMLMLGAYLPSVSGSPTAPVFPRCVSRRTFLRDLERAEIPELTDQGRADRKSLRRFFITSLYLKGVPPETIKRLARHKKGELTFGVYTDWKMVDLKGAVQGLGAVPELTAQKKCGG